jgi:glycerophosphoryl diester phosphodiesterase
LSKRGLIAGGDDGLAQQVGILGIFSDWAGTVSYYASCMGLK